MSELLERLKKDHDLDAADLARMLSSARIAIGIALLIAPGRVMTAWTGEDNPSPALKHAGRSMGARDVALGLGSLVALDRSKSVSRWLEAQAFSDAADCIGTLIAFKHMPRFKRWGYLILEGGAAFLGVQLAAALED
ncbi:MAG: hypothetical protein GEU71_18695 [Actinobacteria bacterium]|nr:hypothetical protein [Actinomycetota bacterium]